MGVDIIVAQGDRGGRPHRGVATLVLVPDVVDAVAPVPVLAAGGIGDGRQVAAALALGAQGVWTGSIWLTVAEADTPPLIRDKLLRAGPRDTVRSRSLTGKPARLLRTAWTDAWDDPNGPGTLPMPLQFLLTVEAQHRIGRHEVEALAGMPVGRSSADEQCANRTRGGLRHGRPGRPGHRGAGAADERGGDAVIGGPAQSRQAVTRLEDVDLFDPDVYVSGVPYDMFAVLRREAPVYRHAEPDGPGFWAVTRYPDVVRVSRNSSTFSSSVGTALLTGPPDEELATMQLMMLNMDPPRHTSFAPSSTRASRSA